MFGGSGKRGFVRTDVSPAEQALSWLVLAALLCVGLAVYRAGQRYDPSLFALDAAHLSAAPARTPADLAARGVDAPVPSAAAAAAAGDVAAVLGAATPQGWQPLGGLERFGPDELYEKIDGRADQYLAYDVEGLTFQSYGAPGDGGQYLDVYVYDLGAAARAFGIYSVERAPGEAAVDLGRGGYRSGASLFFWHGPYYIQVLASATDGELAAAARQVAGHLVARLPDDGAPVAGLELLPRRDLIPGTVQYFARDALSLEFLTRTFVGQYAVGGVEVTGFVAPRASAAAADSLLDQYRAYLADFGTVEIARRHGAGWLRGDLGGFWDVVFRHGSIVAGVTLVESGDRADRAAEFLWTDLAARQARDSSPAPAAAARQAVKE